MVLDYICSMPANPIKKHVAPILPLLFLFTVSFSQTGALKIDFSVNPQVNVGYVIFHSDTVATKYVENFDDTLERKRLMPGDYSLIVRDTIHRTFLTHEFKIVNDSTTVIHVSPYINVRYTILDEADTIALVKYDVKTGFIYTDNSWFDEASPVKDHFSLFVMQGGVASFSKHAAITGGGYYALSHSYFAKDSSLLSLTDRKYERYSYLMAGPYLAVRFTSHNIRKTASKGFLLDLGINYNFPVYFRHVAGYTGNAKMVHGNIHKFTDFRAFAHFGYYPIQLVFEYRPFDFIMGNYPQLPKYFVGIQCVISFYDGNQ